MVRTTLPPASFTVAVVAVEAVASSTPNGVVVPLPTSTWVPFTITPWPISVELCSDWLVLICPEIEPSVVLSFSIPLRVLICASCVVSWLLSIGLVGS